MKKFLFYVFAFFLLLQLLIGFLGISSILQTFAFYFFAFIIAYFLSASLIKNIKTKQNVIIFVLTLFSGLFLTECLLKYGMKKHLSYNERNGDFFYSSPYQRWQLYFFLNKYLFKKNEYDFIANKPYSSISSNKSEFNYEHNYNEHGLRGDLPENIGGSSLLISLGDSFTEGVGTHANSTWPIQLTNFLNNFCPELNSVIINAGISGTDPISQYLILQHLLEFYSPKYVLIAINSTDIGDIAIQGGIERYYGNNEPLKLNLILMDYFYGFSFIARTIIHDFLKLNHFLISVDEYANKEIKAIKTIRDILTNEYAKLSRKFNFTLVVIFHPLLHELENNNFPLIDLHDEINQVNEIICVNLFAEMSTAITEPYINYFWPIDQHNNTIGHSLWAKLLAEKLLPDILLKEQVCVHQKISMK